MNLPKCTLLLLTSLITFAVFAQEKKLPLYRSSAYQLFPDRVVQGPFVAKALSRTELTSTYKSPQNKAVSPRITFKFSLNGQDNEMVSGRDHQFTVIAKNGVAQTPIIQFGEQLKDEGNVPEGTYLAPNIRLTIRLDLRHVLAQFQQKGFFTTFNGAKLYKEDFKGVFVAGGTTPLSWDFANLATHADLKLTDPDGDGIYEVTLQLNAPEQENKTDAHWKLTKNVSAFPQYTSGSVLADALYNLSLEEMQNAIERDSTFRTGKEWAGVWTRDISYSIILSMAYLQPQVAKNSLLRKVNKRKRIIQDTGTGGAYPISSDRMIWAVAAWEIYKATGDNDWLKESFEIIKNSLDDDQQNVFNPVTGLVKGESSFLDWREQTYPRWMQPADIYESENLGTSAVHFQANTVLAEMAHLLGDERTAQTHRTSASAIKKGINEQLWQPEKGYYGQFLYGRNTKLLSPRSEALGEALCVLFGIADAKHQAQIIAKTPVTAFGIPCIYPQIPGIPPYHNNGVWPFVQTYWLWASAQVGNEQSVMESIAAIYRPASLFLTNKENFVADNGDFAGTQINSSNMLWSLSGNISLVHHVLFGIRFGTNSLSFQPFVPAALGGKRSLTNFSYRNARLNIELDGFGNQIASFMLDGKLAEPTIPATLTGTHSIVIRLSNKMLGNGTINKVANLVSPETPVVTYSPGKLTWKAVPQAATYLVLKNGVGAGKTAQPTFAIDEQMYAEYQVIAVAKNGLESFASEPLATYPATAEQTIQLEAHASPATYAYKGFSGNGFVETSTDKNTTITIPVTANEAGTYAIDFRYANGNGPVNTENKCAIRSLAVGGKTVGTIVLPQRGKEEWSNWGFSNAVHVPLKKGVNQVTLQYIPANENMNEQINQAMLDVMRVIKLNR